MGLFLEYMMYIRGWLTFHDTGQIEKKIIYPACRLSDTLYLYSFMF